MTTMRYVLAVLLLLWSNQALAQTSRDEEITIQRPGFQLAGTLSLPAARSRVPAVILITGSGQQTRDEEIPVPGLETYRPFKQIAETLVQRGIAVLRVDDRGMGRSTGRETLAEASTSSFAQDVAAQLDFLRSRPEIDAARIALAGHSEGGSIAMMLAHTTNIRAIVLMAAMGRTGHEINLSQLDTQLAQMTSMTADAKEQARREQRRVVRLVMDGAPASELPPPVRKILPWFREFLLFDPQAEIARVSQPILIVQGELDRQVEAGDARLLEAAARKAGNKDVTTHVLPGLNHLFLPAKTGAWTEYSSLQTTALSPEFLDLLGNWLAARLVPALPGSSLMPDRLP